MRQFLWGTFLPVVGLLTVLALPFIALWLWWWNYGMYLSDYDDAVPDSEWAFVAEKRIASPDGSKELVIFIPPYGDTLAESRVVSAGAPLQRRFFAQGLTFDWRHDGGTGPLPIDIAWVSEDLIRVTYCGTHLWVSSGLATDVGYVDVELVRSEGCKIAVQHSSGW